MWRTVVAACLTSIDKVLRKVLRFHMVPHIGPGLVGKASAQSAEVTAPPFISVNVFQEFLRLLRPCKYSFRRRLKSCLTCKWSDINRQMTTETTLSCGLMLHFMCICAFYWCAHFDCFWKRKTADNSRIGSCPDSATSQRDWSLCPFARRSFRTGGTWTQPTPQEFQPSQYSHSLWPSGLKEAQFRLWRLGWNGTFFKSISS